MMRYIYILILLLTTTVSYAEDLYQVTMLRAAPGSLSALLDETKQLRSSLDDDLVIMRHSQGDHWDLLLMGLAPKEATLQPKLNTPLAFQHSFLSESSTSWAKFKKAADKNGLYHIEMFHAAADQYTALVRQRNMENAYYHGTGRAGNMIFTTVFGNDMDVFTVGFYPDMKAFATDPDLSDETYAKAATDAGFESRSSIGLYLRQFLSSHFDTLATKVR
jgi:hypothetical protein